MFELIVLLLRYVFIFFIVYFLWQAVVYVLNERGYTFGNGALCMPKQRITVSCMHIIAFLILSFDKTNNIFNLNILLFGLVSLGFLIAFWVFTKIIFKKSDALMWNATTFLLDVGIIILCRLDYELAEKQLIWIAISVALMLLIPLALKVVSRFENLELVYLFLGWALFAATYFFGDEKNGATNWIVFPNGYGFQPSEIIKFLFIFYLASAFRGKISKKRFLFSGIMSAGYVGALVLQKDLGGALIFFMTYMIMMYIATNREWLFALGMGAFSIASVVAYKIFPHIRVRVQIWLNPWSDVADKGYQVIHSLFAISTYGFIGSGLTLGSPTYIPVIESDFIYAAICEEFGGIFGIGLIGVFVIIFYRGVHIALRCSNRFYSLISAGIANMLAFQTILILGGVTKLIPLTGVTLPLISYGGSSILVSIAMIGFLQWIYSKTKKAGAKA